MAKISKKKPLGRGLSSLLGENLNVDNLTNSNTKNNLSVIPIDYLSAGSWPVSYTHLTLPTTSPV